MAAQARQSLPVRRLAGTVALSLFAVGGFLYPAASHAAPARFVNRAFTVVSVNTTSTPQTIEVQRGWAGPETTVGVAANTVFLRRYNGKSDISELSAGDSVLITGTVAGTRTLLATTVKDMSIQVAYTQVNATVAFVSRDFSQMTVHIRAAQGPNAPFYAGSTVSADITPTTPVTLLGGMGGTIQQLRPGMAITFYGFSDRAGQVITNPHGITQIPAAQVNQLTVAAPNDNAPR